MSGKGRKRPSDAILMTSNAYVGLFGRSSDGRHG